MLFRSEDSFLILQDVDLTHAKIEKLESFERLTCVKVWFLVDLQSPFLQNDCHWPISNHMHMTCHLHILGIFPAHDKSPD